MQRRIGSALRCAHSRRQALQLAAVAEEEKTIGKNGLSRSDIGLSTHMGGNNRMTGRCAAQTLSQRHVRAERGLTRTGMAV